MNENKNKIYNNDSGKCKKHTAVHTTDPTVGTQKVETEYLYYSKVLSKPFASLAALKEAEAAYFADLKSKEDKAAAKKADAKKVEDAFKVLNFARKAYKNNLAALAERYAERLQDLRAEFAKARDMEQNMIADAEKNYQSALKEFTDKYDQYHLTLKDGDFETTIESHTSKVTEANKNGSVTDLLELFETLFRI